MHRKNIIYQILFECFLVEGLNCLELKTSTACYGILHSNYLKPSCNSGEKMAVVGLSTLAKEQSTSCPVVVTDTSTPDSCCEYDSVDCSVQYRTSLSRNYYISCNGKQTCTVQVSWLPTPCNQTVYLPRTNYMKLEYYCIADQGLEPCTSLNTKDSKVFLWNSGYPDTSMSGSSSCTCSVESSCVSYIRLTAIDIRLNTTGVCKQSITVSEGTTTTVFDCSNNNEYLPMVLFTSTSHFTRLQIDDNLGTAGGFYFILLEGTTQGAELTLSCSSTAQTSPTVAASDLPECPDDTLSTSTTGIATDTGTSHIYSSTTSALTSDASTNTFKTGSSISSTVASTSQTSVDTITGSTINTSSMNTITGSTSSVETSMGTITGHTASTFSVNSGNTQLTEKTETSSTRVSPGWTSTEDDITGTLTSTDAHVVSSSSADITGNRMSTYSATGTSTIGVRTTSGLSTGNTSSTSDDPSLGQSSQSEKSNNIPLIAVIIVLLLIVAGSIIFFILYRDKFKEWCCKPKSSSKIETSEERDEDLLYTSIFDTNLENRQKPNQLPTASTRSSKDLFQAQSDEGNMVKKKRKKKKKVILDEPDTLSRDQTVHNQISGTSNEMKKPKRKRDKTLKKLRKERELQFKPIGSSHDKSIFPSTIPVTSISNRRLRRTSIIDITDSQGKFEKSVEIDNGFQPMDSSSVV